MGSTYACLLKCSAVIGGLIGAGLGIRAAILWKDASEVKTRIGILESFSLISCRSGETEVAMSQDVGVLTEKLTNTIEAANDSGRLNRSAAIWTAWSIGISAVAAFVGQIG
jgi:hypothetical protein